MKSQGIVRRIDGLGRITLSAEDRKILGIKKYDQVEMIRNGKVIILKKLQETCILCDNKISKDNIVYIEDNIVCKKCVEKIKGI